MPILGATATTVIFVVGGLTLLAFTAREIMQARRLIAQGGEITVDGDLQRWLTEFVQERIDEGRKWDIRDGILSLGGELFKEKNKDALSVPRSREELGRIVSRAAAQAEATKKQLQQTAARAVAIISRAGLTAADFSGKSRSFANYFFTVAAGELKPYGATVAKMAAAPEGWGAKGSPAQALAPELQPLLREMCDIYDANRKSWNTCVLPLPGVLSTTIAA